MTPESMTLLVKEEIRRVLTLPNLARTVDPFIDSWDSENLLNSLAGTIIVF